MKEQMRILIGYDGSSCADAALDDLRRAGLPRNAEVLMLAVNEVWLPAVSNNEPSGPRESASSNSSIRESRPPQTPVATAVAPVSEVGALTLAAKGRLQNRFSAWTINVEESSGSPAYELLKRAEELKSHLIVVGCHGRSELGGFLLGSVSQKVVNEARCTVRVSRGTAWKDGSPVRIVIGMDGAPGSELALRAVASRVWPTSSAVRLITAVDPVDSAVKVSLRKKNSAASPAMKRETVEKFMKDASERLRKRSLSVSTQIEEGDPKHVLIATAEEWGADGIFLGASAARNVLERLLLGSVATAIVARAHCSVEVVRNGY